MEAQGLVRLSSRVWLREVELDSYGVRGAVVAGSEAAAVFDSLSHPRDMAVVARLLAGRRVIVVYSHADWDHVWGTAGLPGARVVAHEAAARRFAADVPGTLARMRAAEPGRWEGVVLTPPDETFRERLRLDLGGVTLELSHLPGHTPDSIVGFVPEEGLLLAGDTVETPLPCLAEDGPLEAWIAALERWEGDARVRRVVPAHGPCGGQEIIGQTLGYLRALRDGCPPLLPEALTDFYAATHRDNLRIAAARRADGQCSGR